MASEQEAFDVLDGVAPLMAAEDPDHRPWLEKYYTTHRDRFTEDLGLVASSTSATDRILELGSSPPFLTAALSELGHDVTGVDIDPSRFAGSISRLGLDVVTCNIEHEPLPFDDQTFDLVLMNELFEHLRINPIFTCREVLRVLRPGGRLMLSTPNLWSLRGIFRFMVLRKAYAACGDPFEEYSKLETLGHMGHVREYTAREVSEFLEKVGFSVTRVVYRGTTPLAAERAITTAAPWWKHYFSVFARKPASSVDA